MSRVDESCNAQRLIEQRRLERRHEERARAHGVEFSRMIAKRQRSTSRDPQHALAESSELAGTRSEAGDALLARQGIRASRFAAIVGQQRKQGVGSGVARAEPRDGKARERFRAAAKEQPGVEDGRGTWQDDELAGPSRDDRRRGAGGGDLDDHERGDNGGNEAQAAGAQGGVMQGEATRRAFPTTQAQAAAARVVPPEVVNQIVERVLVGVNENGIAELHVELKGSLLAGTCVHLTAKGGKVSARFETSDANVRRLVLASEGELERAFGRKGLTLERLEVDGW